LTERHEALTQSVELLTIDNREAAAENKKRDQRLGQIMEGIARLSRVAEAHGERPDLMSSASNAGRDS
jgi:hypothetical protein